MTADKRTVATDALETLGMIITEDEKRDAIHLAVDNVIAAHTLRPGEDVGFVEGGMVGVCDNPVGIVDPFLKNAVKKGERFWLVVYPRKITSLRHVWTHPAFDDNDPLKQEHNPERESEEWLRNYADSISVGYQEMLGHAEEYISSGEYWNEGERFEGEYVPDQFWDHYERVTGKKVPADDRGSFFSCSC